MKQLKGAWVVHLGSGLGAKYSLETTPIVQDGVMYVTSGNDDVFALDARTGALLKTAAYVDKPSINRFHSGEAFGDGGLVFALFWGTTLAFLTASGFIIYLTLQRRNPAG